MGSPARAIGQNSLHPILQACPSLQVLLLLSNCPTKTRVPFQNASFILSVILCPLQSSLFLGSCLAKIKALLKAIPFTYNHHASLAPRYFTPLQLPHQNKNSHPDSNSPKNTAQ